MNLKEFYNLLDAAAPFSISGEYCEKYGAYDNSGILLDCAGEIGGALFSLDLSGRAVEKAKEFGADLIVTHHPAIYAPIKELAAGNPLTACARAGISVISSHLNLDCARGGIDDSLSSALGNRGDAVRMHVLSAGGYGSVFTIEKTTLSDFAERLKTTLQTEKLTVYGKGSAERIASFCGAGFDEESVSFAASSGADTIVSSDPKHHLIAEAVERGLNVVIPTHYAAENYGFYRFYLKIKEKCTEVRTEYFADDRLM